MPETFFHWKAKLLRFLQSSPKLISLLAQNEKIVIRNVGEKPGRVARLCRGGSSPRLNSNLLTFHQKSWLTQKKVGDKKAGRHKKVDTKKVGDKKAGRHKKKLVNKEGKNLKQPGGSPGGRLGVQLFSRRWKHPPRTQHLVQRDPLWSYEWLSIWQILCVSTQGCLHVLSKMFSRLGTPLSVAVCLFAFNPI